MKKIKIAIGNDRCARDYKDRIKAYLKANDYEVIDCGTNIDKPVDYPIYGKMVGEKVACGECEYGVLICGTGIGISIAANKVDGIRCGIAYTDEVTKLMREHNDANVISFGRKFMSYDDVERRLNIFFSTDFLGGYHLTRVKQIKSIEDNDELWTEFPEKIIKKDFLE